MKFHLFIPLQTQAQKLMQSWKNLAFENGFVKATFGDSTSWSFMYNAYADKLLNTSLVGDDVSLVMVRTKVGFPTLKFGRSTTRWLHSIRFKCLHVRFPVAPRLNRWLSF